MTGDAFNSLCSEIPELSQQPLDEALSSIRAAAETPLSAVPAVGSDVRVRVTK